MWYCTQSQSVLLCCYCAESSSVTRVKNVLVHKYFYSSLKYFGPSLCQLLRLRTPQHIRSQNGLRIINVSVNRVKNYFSVLLPLFVCEDRPPTQTKRRLHNNLRTHLSLVSKSTKPFSMFTYPLSILVPLYYADHRPTQSPETA